MVILGRHSISSSLLHSAKLPVYPIHKFNIRCCKSMKPLLLTHWAQVFVQKTLIMTVKDNHKIEKKYGRWAIYNLYMHCHLRNGSVLFLLGKLARKENKLEE